MLELMGLIQERDAIVAQIRQDGTQLKTTVKERWALRDHHVICINSCRFSGRGTIYYFDSVKKIAVASHKCPVSQADDQRPLDPERGNRVGVCVPAEREEEGHRRVHSAPAAHSGHHPRREREVPGRNSTWILVSPIITTEWVSNKGLTADDVA